MKALTFSTLSIFFIVSCSVYGSTSDSAIDNFLQCLPNHSNREDIPIYTPTNSSFTSVLQAYAKNSRFLTSATPKPLAIITATNETHVQATVICAKAHGLQVRVRSGGHDYEGLSYVSQVPFVVLDLFNLRAIDIDIEHETAWVQAGATTGELYYKIANKSKVHAFPAGVCTTLGTGGHFSGGGYGTLIRKYGLSVDNIIDAHIVTADGQILDRQSMPVDLFWAIRGGGGASFGVILSWKIKLVRVPPTVTVFDVTRTIELGATEIVYRWQQVAPYLPKDLFIRAMPQVVNRSQGGEKTIQISFIGFYLGKANKLLSLTDSAFPELGLKKNDTKEVSWVESTLFWANFPNGTSVDVLLNRPASTQVYFKSKSDFVRNLIPRQGLEHIWKLMIQVGPMWMQWNPYGGRMNEISESETPFPHRAGYLFKIQYSLSWLDEKLDVEQQLNLMRDMHASMAPYVSKSPRESFLNYRDLDIGSNQSNDTDFNVAADTYGSSYFKNNFRRLTYAKGRVDPDNFFKNEQSIPPNRIING
ncbi:hypothetical protein K2173_026870 [Erythroxylum novogranatense]|uniref:FAD-binding PCMH-type domain-containing protein n=1 Tax=Erythroxylum novogranatense TaxID=1862640 RepID=A0AAV8U191_9ROSI|nr:hypothetical protein K2173_026870 [Erythroxylum novogranatense]